uniref:Splicing factor SRp38 n=1 Tax=Euglena gracilis TaxID=3039 RepID=A0AA51YH59_EUGGR|nr:splicing factor SRp38 [Euglena gracilis]BDX17168.1 serinearginine-rich splicing factor 10 [Euglena gracilis]
MPTGRGNADRPSLYVRNLSTRITPDDLYDAFTKFGKIKDIHIPSDYYTGLPRGFGFVEFYDWRDAEEAQYEMDGKTLDGKRMEINFAQSNRRTPDEMRAREQEPGRSYRDDRDRDRDRPRRDRRDRSRSRSRDRSASRSKKRSKSPKRIKRKSRSSSASSERSVSRPRKAKKQSRSRSGDRKKQATAGNATDDSAPKKPSAKPKKSASRSGSPSHSD